MVMVMLNMVGGIIIDTFKSLKEEMENRKID